MILTSKNNPLIKETASLKDKKARKSLGMFLVEGVKMVNEAKECGLEIDRVFIAQDTNIAVDFDEEKTVYVSFDVMKFLCDEKTPQGVVCRVKIPSYTLQKPTGACLVLDGVADPKNMGAIIRTANASGYKEIYLTDDCTDPYSPKSVRASMSGVFFTKIYQGTREEILQKLENTPILVADMQGENIFSYDAPERFALVIGNEGNGVSQLLRENANGVVKIPMQSTQESLNASVSAGILMYLLKKKSFLDE